MHEHRISTMSAAAGAWPKWGASHGVGYQALTQPRPVRALCLQAEQRRTPVSTIMDWKVQLVSDGPPCQPFSLGGKHGAHSDERDMFPQAIRAVRQIKPKAFVFENVKGLTRAAFRNYFEYIRVQLEHPEVTPVRGRRDWLEHLVRLQRHHASGRRSGLNYRVVTQVLIH
jgi:site-specific DNA-cytosine methylase